MTEDLEAIADAEVDEDARLAREGRGRCRYCGCGYMLNKDGRMRKHYINRDALGPHGSYAVCGGSGGWPA